MPYIHVGKILDTIGVLVDLEPDDQVLEAIVILKIGKPETDEIQISFGGSDGLDWVAQQGLLHCATIIIECNLLHGGINGS